jgi:CO/xanthine dehydrogenase Mo-binding subunit
LNIQKKCAVAKDGQGMKVVGKSANRSDAYSKVTGEALYAKDLAVDGMLHMKIFYSGRPHAKILDLNTTAAELADGVVAVLTARDVPNNLSGLERQDLEVFCSQFVRWTGDRLAAVVATTAEAAQSALNLIEVSYQDLPPVFSTEEALRPDAPQLHPGFENNILRTIQIRKGDVAAAMQQAELIYENTYTSPMQEQAFLETEAGLAYVDNQGQLVVKTGGQDPHADQHQIARALNLPEEKVCVVYGPIGGAFGGRETVSVDIMLALAAWVTRRPVFIEWSRRESFNGHGKRHRFSIRHKWGALKNGKIIAAEIDITSDAGAYAYSSESVLAALYSTCIGSYEIPNVSMDGRTVYTNNVPGGSFRGYGTPQGIFAAELQLGHMAELLEIDPVRMRLMNCMRTGSQLPTQTEIPGPVILPQLIEACAIEAGFVRKKDGWKKTDSSAKTGVGLAIGHKSIGIGMGFPDQSRARVVLEGGVEIERVVVNSAAADVGQGVHTILAQIAAEVTGVDLERVELVPSTSTTIGSAGAASASRLTMFAGKAVELAAIEAHEKWKNEDRPAQGDVLYTPPLTEKAHPESGAGKAKMSYSFSAQAAEVEVDPETGHVRVLRIVAALNPGKAINPQLVEGQIEGGIIQAFGWTLLENLICEDGHILSDEFSTYLIPTAADIPDEVRSLILEAPDPRGPFGAKGIGEVTFGQAAPAILAAIHDATGIWFDSFPVTPQRMLAALEKLTA